MRTFYGVSLTSLRKNYSALLRETSCNKLSMSKTHTVVLLVNVLFTSLILINPLFISKFKFSGKKKHLNLNYFSTFFVLLFIKRRSSSSGMLYFVVG